PIFQNVLLHRPALAIELGQCHWIGVWGGRDNRDEFRFRRRARCGRRFPLLHPPGPPVRIFGRIAVGGAVLFSGRNGHWAAPIADEGDGEREGVSWLLGQGQQETRRGHLAGDLPRLISRQGEKRPYLSKRRQPLILLAAQDR